MRKKILPLFVALVMFSTASAELITVTCNFYTFAGPNETGKCSPTDMKNMRYVVDTNSGKGKMLGNAGSIDVLVIEGTDTISFIQVAPVVTTTTVQLSTMKAVHSRNIVLAGQFMPMQYYGKATSVE